MARTHYDDLDDRAQGEIRRAVGTFLRDGDHNNLAEAMDALGMEAQELWSMIVTEAGLPDCTPPLMIQTGWKQ